MCLDAPKYTQCTSHPVIHTCLVFHSVFHAASLTLTRARTHTSGPFHVGPGAIPPATRCWPPHHCAAAMPCATMPTHTELGYEAPHIRSDASGCVRPLHPNDLLRATHGHTHTHSRALRDSRCGSSSTRCQHIAGAHAIEGDMRSLSQSVFGLRLWNH